MAMGAFKYMLICCKYLSTNLSLTTTYSFYLYPSLDSSKFILLVPTVQFVEFLTEINRKLGTNLTIPSGDIAMAFNTTFPNDGTTRPRYLGESNDKAMADQMKTAPPPPHYNPDKGEHAIFSPNDRSIDAFKQKIEMLLTLERKKKDDVKAKKQKQRIAKQQSWGDAIKRVQRYLGLREGRSGQQQAMKMLNGKSTDWGEWDDAIAEARANPDHPAELDVNSPPLFPMDSDLVFISVDVEAYEKDHTKITEIGISTLDTRDLVGVAPGEGGKAWFDLIRARHFRIKEHHWMRNGEYVHGCPERFMYG